MNGLWFVDRASGIVMLVLFTLSMLLGVLATWRTSPSWWPRLVSTELHRRITELSLTFLAVHVLTAVLDSYVDITWLDVVVPFRSGFRPLWLGLGTLAFDLLLAVALTTWFRPYVTERRWHLLHLLAYVAWPMAVLHAVKVGTDAGRTYMVVLTTACVAVVVVAGVVRLVAVLTTRAGSHDERDRSVRSHPSDEVVIR